MFSETLCLLTKETDKEGKKRGVSIKKGKAGTKIKRSPDGLSHPNKNIIIINKILFYFIKYEKVQ